MPLIMPRLRLTSRVGLFEAQLDCIKASLVREVKAIVDDDNMEHQASVNRGFSEQRGVGSTFIRLCAAHFASPGNTAFEKQR